MAELTLLRRGSSLANPAEQRRLLEEQVACPPFASTLRVNGCAAIRPTTLTTLQINVGKLCNQTCTHCHVDAGPDRREIMSRDTMQACLRVLASNSFETLDITGGAPEMNPDFRWLVQEARALDRRVIDRCNLTILVSPGFEAIPEFLAANCVEIVASLPCYLEANTDAQRGRGVYQKSIAALKRLNELGYGQADSDLRLTLVFNPVGPKLPGNQIALEQAYRRELFDRHGIVFSRLFTITNLPISRFLESLAREGQVESYLRTLVDAFNPETVPGLMCRHTLSVDWQGNLYDCDFNQMLELPLADDGIRHISDFDSDRLSDREIVTGRHCYGCTAGAGSGCSGAIL